MTILTKEMVEYVVDKALGIALVEPSGGPNNPEVMNAMKSLIDGLWADLAKQEKADEKP